MSRAAKSLATLLGLRAAPRLLEAAEAAALAVDGVAPSAVAAPAEPREVAELLAAASAGGIAVQPRGGGTRLELGNPARACDLVLDTRRLNQVLEYSPANLVVRVGAGMTLSALQETLGREGQWLPYDPPAATEATIGGLVAADARGPAQLGYGSARDLVIGSEVATPDGLLSHAGGRVVKNVAGYDLNKLHVGALGTLGVITHLTFKVAPLPQAERTLLLGFAEAEAAARAAAALVRLPVWPIALCLADPAAAARCLPGLAANWWLAARCAGFDAAVERLARECERIGREQGASDLVRPAPADAVAAWARLRDFGWDGDALVRLRVVVPPARLVEALQAVPRTFATDLATERVAQAGSGVLTVRLSGAPGEVLSERLAAGIRNLRAAAGALEGHVVVERAPAALKREVDVWGEIGPALAIMRALKARLDPHSTLNPGRFVGGI